MGSANLVPGPASLSPDPLNGVQISSVPIARLDGVPLTGAVLEPAPPDQGVGAMLGVPRLVLGLDEPEALAGDVRQKASA